MIPVDRARDLPVDTVDKAVAERDKAILAMVSWFSDLAAAEAAGDEPPSKPELSFTQYKATPVKDTLSLLFAGKCAYCESFYSSTQPMDVEHYRPKGAVAKAPNEQDAPDHPGYYWLAASWENLLPSCIDCNRQRHQDEIIDANTSRVTKLGKKDRFPLADDGTRAATHDDALDSENPLLLDPSVDDPSRFLRYDLELGLVLPRFKSGKKHNRAVASIEVYGLNRSGLVHDRRHVIRLIDHRLALIGQLGELHGAIADKPDIQEVVDDVIAQEIAILRELAQPNRPYSGLVQQLLQDLDQVAESVTSE